MQSSLKKVIDKYYIDSIVGKNIFVNSIKLKILTIYYNL